MTKILFLHAHPDDEAIFTGGTIAALADSGHEITVVFATGGELGESVEEHNLGNVRRKEALAACSILGVRNVRFLDYHDSGLDPQNFPTGCLALADKQEASEYLAEILKELEIDTVFCDDENGIYGHPDHRKCHEIAVGAASIHGLNCVTEFTVDGEHLHFVESHVVETAFEAFGISPDSGLFRDLSSHQHPGLTTVEITDTYGVNGDHLRKKREAIAAHPSQISSDSETLNYKPEDFSQVYGIEWFRHRPISDQHHSTTSLFDGL